MSMAAGCRIPNWSGSEAVASDADLMSDYRPGDAAELAEIVARAAARPEPLEILAGGTKRGLGRPVRAAHRLDVSGFSGVREYEPSELILTAGAATPLAEIERLLSENRQMLAFEPPHWTGLLGHDGATKAGPSLGGVLCCNLSGPRRFKAGAARDHFLGFQAVNGRGERFKAGGKVVKNVTGYDLCKLMAGSYGTLAVLTEVTVKVVPQPETERSLVLFGLEPAQAVAAMGEALNSPQEVSGAAWLPQTWVGGSAVASVAEAGTGVTVLRVEGPEPSVAWRIQALQQALRGHGDAAVLDPVVSTLFWGEIREVQAFLPSADAVLWRLSLPPSAAARVASGLSEQLGAEFFLDWGGGVVWLSVRDHRPDAETVIRQAFDGCGGHAILIRAPEGMREKVEVFQPLAPALASLTRRVKESFDPSGILNPGRLYRDL
jgi:glycolate oxidase FAD binding subunit